MLKKMGGLKIQRGRLEVCSLQGLTDSKCTEAVAESFAAISQRYEKFDHTKVPAFLPAGSPEQVNIFQFIYHINWGKKSTLPVHIPDRLRQECAIDHVEPIRELTDKMSNWG